MQAVQLAGGPDSHLTYRESADGTCEISKKKGEDPRKEIGWEVRRQINGGDNQDSRQEISEEKYRDEQDGRDAASLDA